MPVPLLAMSTPDTVVLCLMGFFALRGAFKGFVWQLLRTAGLYGGLLLAARYNSVVGTFLADRFSFVPRTGSDMVGWVVCVVGCFLVVTLIAHLIRDWVRKADLSGIDRTMGLVFGALFGLGVATFGFTLWASTRPRSEVNEALAGSRSTEYMARTVEAVRPLFPEDVRSRWRTVFESLDTSAK